jgi:hypothetical protein
MIIFTGGGVTVIQFCDINSKYLHYFSTFLASQPEWMESY